MLEARTKVRIDDAKCCVDNPRQLLPDAAIFEQFVRSNAVLVDKTELILKLLTGPVRNCFLSRPSRFGRTLLLDTINNIFVRKQGTFQRHDN
ncbi:MAG: AAA family ATPase [Deltaproteobacteria bacterium]|nr:AAA family ATPase [Deltaproteobacteria bacterium]